MSLICGHVFCELCLSKGKNKNTIKCPVDNKETQRLEVPFCLHILKNLPENKIDDEVKCTEHPEKKVRAYCLEDKQFVCSICYKDHKASKHNLEILSTSTVNLSNEFTDINTKLANEWKDVAK